MKIVLLAVGTTRTDYLRSGVEIYRDRIAHYVDFEISIVPDLKSTRSLTPVRQKAAEGDTIVSMLKPGDSVVLLDERGHEFTSREFASFVDKRMASGFKRLVFIIGGPYGFSNAVYSRADFKLSLSRMTFSHEMVRLFFTEQLYRAFTILNNSPYHHD